jgi:hypothetical protein
MPSITHPMIPFRSTGIASSPRAAKCVSSCSFRVRTRLLRGSSA